MADNLQRVDVKVDAAQRLGTSLAARMIAGQGDMSLLDYASGTPRHIRVAAHGLSAQGLDAHGKLIVSCYREDVEHLAPTKVRVDVTLRAPHFQLVATTASVHALGEVEWISDNGPWITGVVDLSTVYVHYVAGTCAIPFDHVVTQVNRLPVLAMDRLAAYDEAAALTDAELDSVMDGVARGALVGEMLPPLDQPVCEHLRNRIMVIDVCEVGVSLLRTTDTSRVAAYVMFPEPVRSVQDLSTALQALVAQTSA